jgi:hypothetical protein
LLHSYEIRTFALLEIIWIKFLLGMTSPLIDNWGCIGGFIGDMGMQSLIGAK